MKGHTFILICALAITKGDRAINGHSDPSKAPEICAAEESNGVLVAHENCNQFYICDAGVPVAFKCYGNLNYNTNGEFCDWPINVDCGDRTICEEQNGDDQDNSATVNDDPNQAAAICAAKDSEGVMIAHENCNQYYKCSGGMPVAYHCQGHLFYDPSKQYCDCVGFVVCGERHIPESDKEDDGSDGNDNGESDNGSCNCNPGEAPKICASGDSEGVLVAHEKCNKFYKCSQGTPVPIKCPGSLLFNPKATICDWPENVECGDRTIPEGDNENNENDGSGDNGDSGNDNDSDDNGSTDNENGDNSDSGNGPCNCNPGEAPKICASEGSEGILVAHEKCNKFYKCAHGKPFPIKCPENLLYNPVEEVCDWPENVECGKRLIPDSNDNGGSGESDNGSENNGNDNGTTDNDSGNGSGNCNPSEAPKICAADESDGVLVAHEKCNKFYMCSFGRPVPMKCPGNLLFNPAENHCDWPENVECGERVIPDPSDNGDKGDSDSDDSGTDDNGNDDNGNSDNGNSDNGNGENDTNDNDNGSCNCNPGEAPQICASEDSEGVLVAHEKCNKFYTCSHGKPVTVRCPSGLLYNPWDQVCDWPANVECGDRVIPDPNDNEDTGDSDNGDIDTGDNGNDNDGTDDGNNDNDNGTGDNDNGTGSCNCNPGEAPQICASEDSEGVLVAHEKCNKFYTCSHGKPVTIRCPSGLLYNAWDQVCDWPENVICGDRVIPDPNDNGDSDSGDVGTGDNGNGDNDGTDNGNNDNGNGAGNCDPSEAPKICAANESDGVLVAHEKCNKFYKCYQGKPIPIRCPSTLLFNPAKDACDWPENVICGDRIIPEGDSDDNGNGDVGTGDNNDNGNEENDNGNGSCNCNPGEAPKICASEESEGVLVAHEKCNKFYTCSHGKPVTIRCPSGLLYNAWDQVCDWPENVKCGDRVIPDPNDNGDSDSGDVGTGDNGNGDNDGTDNGNNDNGNGAGNCDPSEAPKICAANESDGVLVAHEKCNKFYKCYQGKPIPIRCPSTLLFNPAKDACDWPENVICGDRIIPEGDSDDNGNGDVGTGDNNDNGNEENDNGNGSCNCNPGEAPKICASEESEGVLVAHEKCNKFYTCSQGKPVTIRCPSGLLYNAWDQVCDWPENVKCGDRVIPDPNDNGDSDSGDVGTGDNGNGDNDGTDNGNNDNGNGAGNCDPSEAPKICAANESDGVLVAHEKCNKFYKCYQSKPIPVRCPASLLFNPAKDACDWSENVECGDRIIPEGDSDDNGNGDVGTGDNGNDNDNNDNGNEENDNGNGSCNCNPGEAPKICASEESEGVLVAHEKCNKFYTCSQGKPVTIRCPSGLLYNPWVQVCDWPENVKCGDRVIPDPNDNEDSDKGDVGTGDNGNDNDGTDNGNNDNGNGAANCDPSEAPKICAANKSDGVLVAHEKCNKFYTCSQGKPVTIRCPSGLLYNPWDQVCDWPENVKCGDRIIPGPNDNEDTEDSDSGDVGTGDNGNDNDGTDNGNNDTGNGNGDNDNDNGSCNCNPGEAPKICVAEDSEGVLVAHEKCNKFYTCSQGKPVTIRCPSGLLYNPWDQVCDWPENVKCGDRVIPDPNDNEDTGDSDSGDIGTGENDNDGTDNGNNDNGSGSGNCDPSEAPKICAANESDGILVAHEKCNKFYQCNQGKPIPFRCPSSLLFNPAKNTCDWPENVECGDRIIPEGNSEENDNGDDGTGDNGNDNDNGNGDNDNSTGSCNCNPGEAPKICAADASEGVLVAHEKCNKFYTCSQGKPVTIRCPSGLLYNPWDQVCDWPANVECGDRVIPDTNDNEDTGDSDNGDIGTGDNGNDNDGTDDGNNDNDNGNGDNDNGTGSCNCNPGEAPKICASEDSEGVLVAHENCYKFFTCSQGKPVTTRCPIGLLYNPWHQVCDWPENVQCGDRVIPEKGSEENDNDDVGTDDNGNDSGSDNGNNIDCHDDPSQAPIICAATGSDGVLVAHENCNQFYICSEGKPSVLSCPSNLLYNPKIQACDWPQNVNCGDRVIPEEDRDDDSSDNGNDDGSDNDNTSNENSDNGNNIDCHDDPSQAPAICAATGSEGVLVAHENCNQFYVCSEGKPSVLSCPSNLLYNPSIQACDWPQNVNCGDRVIPEEDREDDSSDNGNDNGSDNDNTSNENDDKGNNIDCHDDPSQAPAICAATGSEGVLVAHENCNQFYKCSEGKPTVLSCPNNLLYSPKIQACDWPENVNCGDRVIPVEDDEDNVNVDAGDNDNENDSNNDIDCHDDPSQAPAICATAGSDGVIVAHENCNQFYKCSEGRPTVLSCPNNLLYSPKIQACDWSENVNCGDRVIPEEDGEDNVNVDAGDNDNENDSNNGIDCHDDPSQAPAICATAGSDGVIVAHENCNQFYKCSEGRPSVLSCPNNLLYSPKIQACDWPENVNCGDRVIPEEDGEDNVNVDAGDNDNENDSNNGIDCHDDPSQAPAICAAAGSDGVIVAHENCNQFYVCSEGTPSVLSCPNNLLYDPKIQACDWPQNVNCIDRLIPADEENNASVETDDESENDNTGNDDNGNDYYYSSNAAAICAAPGSDGVLVEHGNCHQFYLCSEGKPIVLDCALNQLYNAETKQCDWQENIKCGNRYIPSDDSRSLSTGLNKHLDSRKALRH